MKPDGYTLEICPTIIAADKSSAKLTPDGHRGYLPLVGFLHEKRLVVGDVFREGDGTPAEGLLELVQNCIRQMPADRKITALRGAEACLADRIVPSLPAVRSRMDRRPCDWIHRLCRPFRRCRHPNGSSYRNGQLASLVYDQSTLKTETQLLYGVDRIRPVFSTQRWIARGIWSSPAIGTADAETIIEQYRKYTKRSRGRIASL